MNNEDQSNRRIHFNWGTAITGAIILFIVTTLSVVAYLVSLDYYVVDKNYYEKAERYQQHIEQVEQASAMVEPVQIKLGGDKKMMTIAFPASVSVDDINGTVQLYRPSDSSLDRTLKLSLDDNRVQHIATGELISGKWIVKIQWAEASKKYFTQKDIFL